ncbi:hypothetical protein [Streptomyces sp. NPDC047108]|uniref:hypothetical protein n=1 Tax=Streptomyces sp. NPDC047108 TaxID=3155025 RepID=UPI0034022D8F
MDKHSAGWWEVILPTRAANGTAGTHTFVRYARTAGEAFHAVLRDARTPAAYRRRRQAHIDTAIAYIVPTITV